MTVRRAALYLGGASLLVAWLSSAASVVLQDEPAPAVPSAPPEESSVEEIAESVQAQTRRLKERLASAPAPEQPLRNPFAFHVAEAPRSASPRRVEAAAFEAIPPAPVEPSLSLIGIAEERQGDVLVRTAMLVSDPDQLTIAAAGDIVLGRYKVVSIGANHVELTDITTATPRRLTLDSP